MLTIRNARLRTRMMAVIVSAVLGGYLISMSTMTWQASRAQKSIAMLYAEQLAQTRAAQVRFTLESAIHTAQTLAQTLQGLRAAGSPDRAVSNSILKSIIESHPEYLGVWTVWEPNAFDGKDRLYLNTPSSDSGGRYLPYWNRGSGKVEVEAGPTPDTTTDRNQDWYQLPKRSGKDVVIEPYLELAGGNKIMMTSLAVPMSENGKFVGVSGIDIALSELQNGIEKIQPFGTGYVSLITNKGQYVGDRDATNVGQPFSSNGASAEDQAAVREGRYHVSAFEDPRLGKVTRIYVPVEIGDTGTFWSFAITVPEQAMMAEVAKLQRTAIVMALLSVIVVSLGLAFSLNRLVLRPIGGEPDDAVDLARRVADGDLSLRINVSRGDTSSLMSALQVMQERLSQVVAGVRHNANGVALASVEIAQGNLDLSGRTEEQAAALEQTAASMEEFAATVGQNADNAKRANALAGVASNVAIQCGKVVGEVVDTMRDINESSHKITDIVSVIEGIAFQTNILALNAAVEAARAGENGRGFAVVASEVRNLAQRSATAAKEIKGLIGRSVEWVERGSVLVDQAGSTMTDVVDAVQRVAAIMSDITVASDEQKRGIVQIGDAVNLMEESTQRNAALVEESAAAALILREQAQDLAQAVATFRLEKSSASIS
ncbi:methyl-accepting chemotaxis sensory transducer with Cache sensor [Burkholderia sp. OK233]|nr:methyl-accepting chemotaxis sensory transducer with Cache sensor [Burkholderia sp. OK233]